MCKVGNPSIAHEPLKQAKHSDHVVKYAGFAESTDSSPVPMYINAKVGLPKNILLGGEHGVNYLTTLYVG